MLRFEQHTATKWNVFHPGELGGYVGSIWTDGTFLGNGTRCLTVAELKSIIEFIDQLNTGESR